MPFHLVIEDQLLPKTRRFNTRDGCVAGFQHFWRVIIFCKQSMTALQFQFGIKEYCICTCNVRGGGSTKQQILNSGGCSLAWHSTQRHPDQDAGILTLVCTSFCSFRSCWQTVSDSCLSGSCALTTSSTPLPSLPMLQTLVTCEEPHAP